MSQPPRVLLTNDDGIDAEGLAVLEQIAADLTNDYWVVAPETNQSGTAHSLTIRRPLRVRKLDDRRFAVDGTPTDCVMLAIQAILPERPTLVLSGVNNGANVAEDVTYSGTVGAAIEATLFGIPAIALSQVYRNADDTPFEVARAFGPTVVRRLLAHAWGRNVLMSVNFPACAAEEVAGIEVVDHGQRKLGDDIVERADPRGETYYWIGHLRSKPWNEPDTDLDALRRKRVSVTPINLSMTDRPTLERLRRDLDADLGAPSESVAAK